MYPSLKRITQAVQQIGPVSFRLLTIKPLLEKLIINYLQGEEQSGTENNFKGLPVTRGNRYSMVLLQGWYNTCSKLWCLLSTDSEGSIFMCNSYCNSSVSSEFLIQGLT